MGDDGSRNFDLIERMVEDFGVGKGKRGNGSVGDVREKNIAKSDLVPKFACP